MFKTIFATILLSTSLATPTLKADVLQPKAVSSNNVLVGSYNYVDDFSDLWDYLIDNDLDVEYNLYPDTTSCYMTFNNPSYSNYCGYLNRLLVHAEAGGTSSFVDLTWYLDTTYAVEQKTKRISYGDILEDIECPALIMCFMSTNYISGDFANVFNLIFTTDDNAYTTTYNGYYNFLLNGSLTSNKLFVMGSVLFNNSLYFGFNNQFYPFPDSKDILFNYFDVENYSYYFTTFDYPFNDEIFNSTNILMTGCKMSKETYQYLSSIGVFAYQRNTSYDNSTFKDLLFSLMDSPIYMITQLLSFELFGVNMFVALTGLLTIIVILILIRKFW